MLVFVDESGDPGIKGKQGSSRFFIVTAVLFEEEEEAMACDNRIGEIRTELRMHPGAEFHFNKCCDAHRMHFLHGVANMQFFYLSFVLNKSELTGPGFAYKESLYKYATRLLFENAKGRLTRASITIDKSGNREFNQQLQSYLKRKLNTDAEIIRKVKCEASHSNNLLQLADMVCGAVARSFNREKNNARVFRKAIGHRELEVQVWPRV